MHGRAGLSSWSPGSVFLLFLVQYKSQPTGQKSIGLASAVPLTCAVTPGKSFPFWFLFLLLNQRDPGICHLRQEMLALT